MLGSIVTPKSGPVTKLDVTNRTVRDGLATWSPPRLSTFTNRAGPDVGLKQFTKNAVLALPTTPPQMSKLVRCMGS
jgi:hypothetical protein